MIAPAFTGFSLLSNRADQLTDRTPRRRRRRARWLVLGVILITLLLVYRHYTSSAYLAGRAAEMIHAATGAEVDIASAEFSLSGAITLNDVKLSVPDMRLPQASELFRAGSIELGFDWLSILFGRVEPRTVTLVDPVVSMTEDLERRVINFEMLRLEPSTDAQPARLPRVDFTEGQFRYGVVQRGRYRAMGRATLGGQLAPDMRQHGRYQVSLHQVDADPADGEEPTVLAGAFDVPNRTASFRLRGLRFTEDYRTLLPAVVRQQWAQFEPSGTLPEVSFAYDPNTGWRTVVTLRDVGLTLPQLGTDESRFRMSQVRGELIFASRRIEVKQLVGRIEDLVYRIDGEIDGYSADAPFRLTLRTEPFDLPAEPRYIFALPEPVQQVFRMLTPVGRLRVSMALWRPTEGGVLDYTGTATIIDGTGHYHRFTYPLSNCRGLVVFNREAIEVKNLTGDTPGGGTVTIAGSVKPPGEQAAVDLVVTAVDLPFDERLYHAFEPDERKALDLFFHKPSYAALRQAGHYRSVAEYEKDEAQAEAYRNQRLTLDENDQAQRLRLEILLSGLNRKLAVPGFELGGRANVVVSVRRPPGKNRKYRITVDLELKQASCMFRYFPYPVRVTGGRLHVGPDEVVFRDVAMEGLYGGVGRLNGRVTMPDESTGRGARPELTIAAAGLPVDDLLRDALEKVLRGPQLQWLTQLNAEGTVDVAGRILTRADGRPDVDLDVDLADMRARPGEPGYALTDVTGRLGITLGGMEIDKVRARHGRTRLEVNGKTDWSGDAGGRVELTAAARDMAFDDPVIDLLSPFTDAAELRNLWTARRPAGRFDVDVTYHRLGDEQPDYVLAVQPRTLAVDHKGTRIELAAVSGTILIEPDLVRLEELAGDFEGGRVALTGTVAHAGALDATLHVKARGRRITPGMRRTLPQTLIGVIDRLKIDGAYEINLPVVEMQAAQDPHGAARTRVKGTVKLTGGSMNVGVPIRDLVGRFDVDLEQTPDRAFPTVDMTARIESMEVLDRHVTDFEAVASSSRDAWQLVIPVMRGRLADGTVGGSGRLGLDKGAYEFRLALSDVDLTQLIADDGNADDAPVARASAGPDAKNDPADPGTGIHKGLVSASLDVQGVWGRPEKLRGRGDVQIREAQMYDLPLSLGVLQLTHLSLPMSRSFNRALMSYYVQNDTVTFERLVIESPNMRLAGGGTLNTDTRTLDLTLTSSNPRGLELGPLTELIKGFRDQIITVRVTGTIDEPDTRIRQFTGIKRAWNDVWDAGATDP